MMSATMRGHHRLRGSLALVTAALCLAFVVELSPHLVHHLVDPLGHTECPFATVHDRQPGDLPVVALVAPVDDGRATVVFAAAESAPARPVAPPDARAPPLTAS